VRTTPTYVRQGMLTCSGSQKERAALFFNIILSVAMRRSGPVRPVTTCEHYGRDSFDKHPRNRYRPVRPLASYRLIACGGKVLITAIKQSTIRAFSAHEPRFRFIPGQNLSWKGVMRRPDTAAPAANRKQRLQMGRVEKSFLFSANNQL